MDQRAWPADRRSHRAFGLSQSEEYFFAVLGKKSRSGLKHAGLPARSGLHRDRGTDRISIAFAAAQTESDRWRKFLRHILQEPQLGTIAVLQKHFQPAIVVEVSERECPAILDKIHAYRARDVGKRSIPVVRIEDIAFVSAPRPIRADEFVKRVPTLFVGRRRFGFDWRIGHHLPPEKAVQVIV